MTNQDLSPVKEILGVSVSSLTHADAVALLDHLLEEKRPTPIAFLNANAAVFAHDDPEVYRALKKGLVFNDGVGLNIGCLMKYGVRFPTNLNGTDFVPAFLRETKHRLRIYLLGARPDVVEKTARIFAYLYPSHEIVGYHNGYISAQENEWIIKEIKTLETDLLLVAMGNCMQELWIGDYFEETGANMAMGVGALFDFAASRVLRAPALFRAMSIEWVWRLMLEPRRLWKRYTVNSAKFLFDAAKDALAYRMKKGTRSSKKSPDFAA